MNPIECPGLTPDIEWCGQVVDNEGQFCARCAQVALLGSWGRHDATPPRDPCEDRIDDT